MPRIHQPLRNRPRNGHHKVDSTEGGARPDDTNGHRRRHIIAVEVGAAPPLRRDALDLRPVWLEVVGGVQQTPCLGTRGGGAVPSSCEATGRRGRWMGEERRPQASRDTSPVPYVPRRMPPSTLRA